MSEEVKIKISQPMFEVGELERFDNNIQNIVEEYSKLMFKEKDQILTQRIIIKQEEEIERLTKEIVKYDETLAYVNNTKDKEIERLTELCNKYEEEHKTTFEIWQKDIKENEQLRSIIKEARELLNQEWYSILRKETITKIKEILDKVEEK